MRHDHLKRELQLLLLLAQNRQYTSEDICKRLDISRRSLYYYINFFEEAGFIVEKRHGYYSISRDSDFFKKLCETIKFTDEEAVLMRQLIEESGVKSLRMKALKAKLERFYDFKILEDENIQQKVSRILTRLYDAVKNHKMVKIVGYSSSNSRSVSDRIVEPFLFMNNNNDIRCYELSSGINKTFRLSRMDDVEIIDAEWIHEDRHRKVYVDLFNYSSEDRFVVEMILDRVARNELLDEYPNALPMLAEREDGRWLFKAEMCSNIGVGRFVLGLYDNIEVIGCDSFKEYLRSKIKKWAETFG